MSSFTAPLIVEIEQIERDGRGLARLAATFQYHIGAFPSDDVITVPAGFVTDFASIPAILTPIFPVLGQSAKAAVVHDWLLVEGVRPRVVCDAIFLEAMTVLKVPVWRRTLMWLGVRLYGILKPTCR